MAHEFVFGSEGTQPWGDALCSSKTSDLESQDRHSLLRNENVSFPDAALTIQFCHILLFNFLWRTVFLIINV